MHDCLLAHLRAENEQLREVYLRSKTMLDEVYPGDVFVGCDECEDQECDSDPGVILIRRIRNAMLVVEKGSPSWESETARLRLENTRLVDENSRLDYESRCWYTAENPDCPEFLDSRAEVIERRKAAAAELAELREEVNRYDETCTKQALKQRELDDQNRHLKEALEALKEQSSRKRRCLKEQLAAKEHLVREAYEMWDLADDVLELVMPDEEATKDLVRWREIADKPRAKRTPEEVTELRALVRKLTRGAGVPVEVTLDKFRKLREENKQLRETIEWPRLSSPPSRAHDGEFPSYHKWVQKAAGWIGGCNAVCFDAKDRLCHIGRDFARARDEDAFPVRFWFPSSAEQERGQTDG